MVKVIRESEKINNNRKNAEEELKQSIIQRQESNQTVIVGFTKADIDAISKAKDCLKSKDFKKYMHHTNANVMTELLKQHEEVDKLYLSDTSGTITKLSVSIDEDLHDELKRAASKASVQLGEYIRGVIYSRSKQLREEKHNRYLADKQRQEDNRVVRVNLFLDKDTRQAIYKKHGKMNDTELAKVVQREALKHLSK